LVIQQTMAVFSQNMVAGFNEKNKNACNSFHHTFQPFIRERVIDLVGESSDVDDLVQITFIKIFRSEARFETLRNIQRFVEKVCDRTCLDHLKQRKLRRSKAPLFAFYHEQNEQMKENRLVLGKVILLKYLALEILPPQSRQIISLSYVDGLKNKAIAEKLGIAEKTVENHKTIAIKKLKLEIEKRGGPDVSFWLMIFPGLAADLLHIKS
jgi:RNA polymerase sigma factor (sigma-70 family)